METIEKYDMIENNFKDMGIVSERKRYSLFRVYGRVKNISILPKTLETIEGANMTFLLNSETNRYWLLQKVKEVYPNVTESMLLLAIQQDRIVYVEYYDEDMKKFWE